MLKNILKTKLRVTVLALTGFTLILGTGAASAQVYCHRVQAHSEGDIVRVWGGPYVGWYDTVVPCRHWVTICE